MLNMLLMLVVLTAPPSPPLSGVVVAWWTESPYAGALQSTVTMAPDGKGLTLVPCVTAPDLSWGGSPRYYLDDKETAFPDGSTRHAIVAYPEDSPAADCSNYIVLLDDPTVNAWASMWSPDGSRVAFIGSRMDPVTGETVEAGIFVADVFRHPDGTPAYIDNVRHVVPAGPSGIHPVLSWSGDNHRITFSAEVPLPPPAYSRPDVFVADVDALGPDGYAVVTNVTNTPDAYEFFPALSPVSNEILFMRAGVFDGKFREDIFKRSLDTGVETRLTDKKNDSSGANASPAWSPTGDYVLVCSRRGTYGDRLIYRMPSNGGKLTQISGNEGNYSSPRWRP